MAYYSSIIKELDASRKLGSELALEKHQQDLQRSKLERELQDLRRSRKQYIDTQITHSKLQYEKHLQEDSSVSDEHKRREQRTAQEKAKIAQKDFEIERDRLLKERNEYDLLDKQNRIIEKQLLTLQTRSRVAHDDEDRKLFELDTKKKAILKLLEESRQRELYHFERAKQLAI